MVASFVLVHSPVVGPLTWAWVAEVLRRRGHPVVVPSLVRAAVSGSWQACVDVVVRDAPVDERSVLVGHSGAGPLLPAIASHMDPSPARLVFVDAGLPAASGEVPLVADPFIDVLTPLARDGMLPRWSEWFGPGTMEALIPDRDRRAAVLAGLPELPLTFFKGRVPMPSDWPAARGAYILLSEPYRSHAAEAAARGWPVVELLGAHLDIVTRPTKLADALLDVAGA